MIHIWYCAYILNLIIKYELEVIKNEIERIREGVLYWRTSPKRKKGRWKTHHVHILITKKNGFDCPTRDSTCLMLKNVLIYKDVFAQL